jgi:uncharacterized protein (TIGR02996 family)
MSDYWKHPRWQAFLASIREQPEDDLRRLVAADWLDEQGESERAEFIRVQCEIARIGVCRDECRSRIDYRCRGCVIRSRERELLERHHRLLFPPPPKYFPTTMTVSGPHDGSLCWIYSQKSKRLVNFAPVRGFVHTVRAPLAVLIGDRCDVMACNGTGLNTELRAKCSNCNGTGRTPGVLRDLLLREPVERVEVKDMPIYPSAGNDTYYVGGIGRLPREYWSRLDNHPSRMAAASALSDCLLDYCRTPEEVSK